MSVEEQATGCQNAHSYREYAKAQGFTYCKVLNWMSSAGDWQFLVATNKRGPWCVLYQTNNYPRAGFSHAIDRTRPWYGTLNSVYKQIEQAYR